MRGRRELRRRADIAVDAHEVPALACLGHAEVGRVEEGVPALVPELVEPLRGELRHVLPTVREDVGDVLHEHRDGPELLDVSDVRGVQLPALVAQVGLGVLGDLAQLGAPDASIGLTGRATDDHVDLDVVARERGEAAPRFDRRDVTGPRVARLDVGAASAVKVARVGTRTHRLQLQASNDLGACLLEAE